MIVILHLVKNFVLKYWKYIALAVALIAVYSFVYNQGYSSAYKNRTDYYEKTINAHNQQVINKLDSIEKLAINEADKNAKNKVALVEDLTAITQAIKNKKTYVIKNGECNPSKEFLDSYNSIILRGNQK